jgi:ABC-2 type transport system ATP-binding protein
MNAIEVAGLHKRYGSTVAVDDISFSIAEGEVFGILGPNGAGKSTTVECVSGVREPDRGSISILGLDPHEDRDQLRERVGVQLQQCRLPALLRVAEAMDLWASFYRKPRDWRVLMTEMGLDAQRDTAYGHLSGGQQQRLSIALALVGDPDVVFLDELTTGLDPQARRNTWDLVRQVRDRGATVVLVTHMMDEAERLCDRIALIDNGRVVSTDTPEQLVAGVSGEQRLRFRTETPVDATLLADLPQVIKVVDADHPDSETLVIGTGNLFQAVSVRLAQHDIVATDMRVDKATLEDAYIALTGHSLTKDGQDQ